MSGAVTMPLRALVVGLGSIGQRHLQNLRTLFPEAQIAVWRREGQLSEPIENVHYVSDAQAAIEFAPQFAILANPAPMRLAAASALAAAGIHLLLEKPIADRSEGIAELLADCRKRGLVVAMGYTLRFNESLRAARQAILDGSIGRLISIRSEVGSYLPDWRPGIDYRTTVSASAKLGGGAVLELSHELDYVRWIGGEVEAVHASLATVSDLELDVEDTAEITLQMQNGSLAQIHLDLTQRASIRQCRFIGTEGTCVWDGIANKVTLLTAANRAGSVIHDDGKPDRNQMYLAELDDFLEAIRSKTEPAVSGADGLRVLEIALAAKQSHREQRTVRLSPMPHHA